MERPLTNIIVASRADPSGMFAVLHLQDFCPLCRPACTIERSCQWKPSSWDFHPFNLEKDWQLYFTCSGDKEIQFSFYSRGKPVSSRCLTSFRNLLSLPEHNLNADELLDNEVLIRDAAEDIYFDIRDCRTEMLYLVEGCWKLSQEDSLGIFIDRGDGWVDELYFLAPSERFAEYLPLV